MENLEQIAQEIKEFNNDLISGNIDLGDDKLNSMILENIMNQTMKGNENESTFYESGNDKHDYFSRECRAETRKKTSFAGKSCSVEKVPEPVGNENQQIKELEKELKTANEKIKEQDLIIHGPEHDRTVITKSTLINLFGLGKDEASLYFFYLKNAMYQDKFSIFCANEFVMRGLHIGKAKLLRAKKSLIENGFITITRQSKTGGRYSKEFIQVQYKSNKLFDVHRGTIQYHKYP